MTAARHNGSLLEALAVCAMACGARSLYAICQWGGMAKMSRRIPDRWRRAARDARADGDGTGDRIRTRDPVTTDEPLHQLSYAGSMSDNVRFHEKRPYTTTTDSKTNRMPPSTVRPHLPQPPPFGRLTC